MTIVEHVGRAFGLQDCDLTVGISLYEEIHKNGDFMENKKRKKKWPESTPFMAE